MSGIRAIRALLRGNGPTRWVSVEHDTVITDPQDGDLLSYFDGMWVNIPLALATSDPIVASTSFAVGTGESLVWQHTTPPGANRRLIIASMAVSESPSDDNGFYGDIEDIYPMLSRGTGTAPFVNMSIWEYSDPAVGTHQITIAQDGPCQGAVIAVSLNNVRPSGGGFGHYPANLLVAQGTENSETHETGDLTAVTAPSGDAPPILINDIVLMFAIIEPGQEAAGDSPLTLLERAETPGGQAALHLWTRTADDGEDTTVGYTMDADSTSAWIAVVLGSPS